MTNNREYRSSLILAAAMAGAGLMSGCAAQSQTTSAATHQWDAHEAAAYQRYMMDEHMPRREFSELSPQEQQAYWDWRARHQGN